MKQTFGILISLLGICLLAQCDDRDFGEPHDERIPVLLSFENIAHTRVSEDTNWWEENDIFGVFMINSGTSFDIQNIEPTHMKNTRFLLERGRIIQLPHTDTTYYVPQRAVDFIAYYPWQHSDTLSPQEYKYFPVDLSDQQAAHLDVLYSNNATHIDREASRNRVNLVFKHVLSKMEVEVSAGIEVTDASVSKIELSGIYRKGNFMLANGKIENVNSKGTTVLKERTTPGLYRAFIIPQGGDEYQLHINLQNGDMFTYNFPAGTKFEQGKIHTYDITVNKTGINVTNNNITPWVGKDDDPIEDKVN